MLAQAWERPDCTVMLTDMLQSEILNAWLRRVTMQAYAQTKGINPHQAGFFKNTYRPSRRFRNDLLVVRDELAEWIRAGRVQYAYTTGRGAAVLAQLGDHAPTAGHNDLHHYLYCAGRGIPVITNDADFRMIYQCLAPATAAPVYSYNPALYHG